MRSISKVRVNRKAFIVCVSIEVCGKVLTCWCPCFVSSARRAKNSFRAHREEDYQIPFIP